MGFISCSGLKKVDVRVGTIIVVKDFPKARNPTYIITVDLGELGGRKSSVQSAALYQKGAPLGKDVTGVVNFAPK